MYQTSFQNKTSEFFKYIIGPSISILLYIFFVVAVCYGIFCGLYMHIQPIKSIIDDTPAKNILLPKFKSYMDQNEIGSASIYLIKILSITILSVGIGIVLMRQISQ